MCGICLSNDNAHSTMSVAGFPPGSRSTFVLAKVDKTTDALPDHIRLDGRIDNREGAGQLAVAQTRPADC